MHPMAKTLDDAITRLTVAEGAVRTAVLQVTGAQHKLVDALVELELSRVHLRALARLPHQEDRSGHPAARCAECGGELGDDEREHHLECGHAAAELGHRDAVERRLQEARAELAEEKARRSQ